MRLAILILKFSKVASTEIRLENEGSAFSVQTSEEILHLFRLPLVVIKIFVTSRANISYLHNLDTHAIEVIPTGFTIPFIYNSNRVPHSCMVAIGSCFS